MTPGAPLSLMESADERRKARHLTALAVALLLAGAALGWTSHLSWVERNEASGQATWLRVAWHGFSALFPFALLAAAAAVLPRPRNAAATLCVAAMLVTAVGVVGFRPELLSDGPRWPSIRLGPSRESVQWSLALIGAFITAAVGGRHSVARR